MKRILAAICMAFFVFLSCAAAAEALLCVNTADFAALIGRDGEPVIRPGAYKAILTLIPDRLFAGLRNTSEGERYALVDAQGRRLTRFTMETLSAAGDAVIYRTDGLWGALNAAGQTLLAAVYSGLDSPDGERFLATLPGEDPAVNPLYTVAPGQEPVPTGRMLLGELCHFHEGLMRYRDAGSGLWGYLDSEGQAVIAPTFDSARDFEHGVAMVSRSALLGLIRPNGEWLMEPRYTWLEVGQTRAVGLLPDGSMEIFNLADARGVWFTHSDFTQCAILGDRVVARSSRGVYAFDQEGTLNYRGQTREQLYAGCAGQLIVSIGEWGQEDVRLLSADGRILPGRWNWLIPLSDDRYAVLRLNGETYLSEALDQERLQVDFGAIRYGMMDTAGREILPCEALNLSALGSDRYLLESEDGYRVVDEEGGLIWETEK